MVRFSEKADLYLVNSCTVTGRSDSESRKLLRRARRANPDARVVATGCYAQVSPTELQALAEVDQVLGNREKHDILMHIDSGANQVSNLSDFSSAGQLKLTSFADHTRAFLQVQTGCENRCSYCIVPIARGPSRSVPVDDILETVQRLAAKGYHEIVLTGIHLGAYSPDIVSLLQTLEKNSPVERLRLGSIEPNELSDELLELIASSRHICPHLHIPLQSGSDSVLKRMKRCYDRSHYRSVVLRAAKRLPDAFIAADVIAGFPGESEQEFEDTCSLIAELPFGDLHVFPYSRRPGTEAAEMPGQTDSAIIRERAAILQNMAKLKQKLFRERFIGRTVEALGLSYDSTTGLVKGLTRNYLEICYEGNQESVNQLCMIKIAKHYRNRLHGFLNMKGADHGLIT